MKKSTVRVNTKHINAMLRALVDAGSFTIDANFEANTVLVTHKIKGEVLKGIRASDADLWVINHNEDLFK